MQIRSNAPGQLLGFTIEFPRALYHLLKSGPDDLVCVEYLGDVATIKSCSDIATIKSSDIITEEDKSSIIGNPLANKSSNLWKTFFNWIDLIETENLDVNKIWFVLYCNNSGKDGIVNCFHSAKSHQEAQKAIDYAKKELNDIDQKHEIWKYYDYVVNQHETLMLEIVKRFELQIGNGSGFEEVRHEIRRMIVPEKQVEYLIDNLCGWVLKRVSEKIVDKKPAIISWEEFNLYSLVLFERVRSRELIDFALLNPHRNEELQSQVKHHPIYIQQLGVIKAPSDEIITAVNDYLRADVNRNKWIENGIINDDIAAEFELKLKEFWNNQKKRIQLTHNHLSLEERGQLLLLDCKLRQETIGGTPPPPSTISGTYHALADTLDIGWHPNWGDIFTKKEEE